MKVSLVQQDIVWENPIANFARLDELLAGIESDLIILPEMFSTGFTMNTDAIQHDVQTAGLDWMIKKAKEKSAIICGSLAFKEENKFFNRLYWVTPDGSYSMYNKRHLFSLAKEDQVYQKGSEKLIVEMQDFSICPQICYDLRFPVWTRNTDNYDVLIYVANWPKARVQHWRQLLIARAIENQCYVIGVNRFGVDGGGFEYSGHSAAIAYDGEVMTEVVDHEKIINIELDLDALKKYRERFPFLKDRDAFHIL